MNIKYVLTDTQLPVLLISQEENIFVFMEIWIFISLINLHADNTETPKITIFIQFTLAYVWQAEEQTTLPTAYPSSFTVYKEKYRICGTSRSNCDSTKDQNNYVWNIKLSTTWHWSLCVKEHIFISPLFKQILWLFSIRINISFTSVPACFIRFTYTPTPTSYYTQ
jgi:hypothetical protein